MNTTVNPQVLERYLKASWVRLTLIAATIVGLVLRVLAFLASGVFGFFATSDVLSQASRADAARYEAAATLYARQRSERADAARLTGLAKDYLKGVKAEKAEIARWNGLAGSYLAAENAAIARWNGWAQFYEQRARVEQA